MSANPGDRPRDDSFEDKGSPAQDAKDGDVKHVVSLRRQTDAPAPPTAELSQIQQGTHPAQIRLAREELIAHHLLTCVKNFDAVVWQSNAHRYSRKYHTVWPGYSI